MHPVRVRGQTIEIREIGPADVDAIARIIGAVMDRLFELEEAVLHLLG